MRWCSGASLLRRPLSTPKARSSTGCHYCQHVQAHLRIIRHRARLLRSCLWGRFRYRRFRRHSAPGAVPDYVLRARGLVLNSGVRLCRAHFQIVLPAARDNSEELPAPFPAPTSAFRSTHPVRRNRGYPSGFRHRRLILTPAFAPSSTLPTPPLLNSPSRTPSNSLAHFSAASSPT